MSHARPQLYTIPPGISFARALCLGVIERAGKDPFALADSLIFVPTRRAARGLRETFAEILDRPALLPRIVALADADEEIDPADLARDVHALPVIAPLRRRLLLATLVQRWGAAKASPIPLHQALNSALSSTRRSRRMPILHACRNLCRPIRQRIGMMSFPS